MGDPGAGAVAGASKLPDVVISEADVAGVAAGTPSSPGAGTSPGAGAIGNIGADVVTGAVVALVVLVVVVNDAT